MDFVALTDNQFQSETQIHTYKSCRGVVDSSNPDGYIAYATRNAHPQGNRGVKFVFTMF